MHINSRSLIILLAGVLLLPLLASTEESSGEKMLLTHFSGDVKYQPTASAKAKKPSANMQLAESGVIITGKGASARIRFMSDNTEFFIPEGKTVILADLIRKKQELLKDKQKLLLNKLKLKINKDDDSGYAGPSAVAGVRGDNKSKGEESSTNEVNELFWDE